MRVVISGYYGYHNVGDEAILKSIITALRSQDANIEIVVLSNDIEYTKKTYNVEAINRWNILQIYNELRKSDGLISGGGSLLQDATSNRPIKYYTFIMKIAKLVKKPVFIYAQGVGPISDDLNKKITKKSFEKADYITLRDKESIDLVKSIGVTKSIDLVSDPVMGFSIDGFESNICDKYEGDYISISVRDWDKAKTDFLKKVAKACDDIIENGYNVVFLPMHGRHDYETSRKVSDMMNNDCDIFPHESSIEEKILCIKKSKLMIGMRLHALIFAASANTPMIGISYDPKIDSFLNLVNQLCIGSVDDNWSGDDLSHKALIMLKNYKYERSNVIEESKELKIVAKHTAIKAIEIFKK